MRQFYGRLEKKRPFCRKSHVHKIPRFRGGGYFGFLGGGGGSADFIFMGARIFLKFHTDWTECPRTNGTFQRVSNAALANAALVLSSKNWKKYSRWGAASKNKSKKPWASCRRAGIDAALVRVQFVLRGCTHHRK